MNKTVTAKLSSYRLGPRKLRLLADLVRGKKVSRALSTLSVLNKKGAYPLIKLINSAVANAKHNHNLPPDDLFISAITVDGGPVLKRWMPKAHGRATPVRERTSHIKLALAPMIKKEKINRKQK